MSKDVVTADLSHFGGRELKLAADLLFALDKNGASFLGEGLTLNCNTSSGFVFLSDEDFNVGMLQDGVILQFFSCPNCGKEGFDSEITDSNDYTEKNYPFKVYEGCCSEECAVECGYDSNRREETW